MTTSPIKANNAELDAYVVIHADGEFAICGCDDSLVSDEVLVALSQREPVDGWEYVA